MIPSNADFVRAYKRLYKLTTDDIAEIIMLAPNTIKSWLLKEDSSNHSPMKDRELAFLECRLQERTPIAHITAQDYRTIIEQLHYNKRSAFMTTRPEQELKILREMLCGHKYDVQLDANNNILIATRKS